MAKITIDKKRCKGCQLCIICCPKKNIKIDTVMNEGGILPAVVVEVSNCTGCGLCFVMCPDVAIEIEADNADETLNSKHETLNKSKIQNSRHDGS